jgi:hypothetical protein
VSTTSQPRPGREKPVVRDGRLYFEGVGPQPGRMHPEALILAVAGIGAVVLLSNWLRTSAACRNFSLDMRRLHADHLATAGDAP